MCIWNWNAELGKLINVRCALCIWNSCTFLWTTNMFICSSSASFLAPNRPVLNLTGRVESLILDKLSFVFPRDNKSAITIPWSVVKFRPWLNRWRSCAERPPLLQTKCSRPDQSQRSSWFLGWQQWEAVGHLLLISTHDQNIEEDIEHILIHKLYYRCIGSPVVVVVKERSSWFLKPFVVDI